MSLREMGFTLESEIPVLEDELEDVKEDREDIKDRASQLDKTDDEYKSLKREWGDVEAERVELESKISRFQEFVDEWDSTRFVVRELTFGEVQNVKDIVSSESFDVDVELQSIEGTPLQGLYQTEILDRAVEEMPDDAPDNPNDLPEIVGDWLMDKAESINSLGGDDDMGNMSLEEAISSDG